MQTQYWLRFLGDLPVLAAQAQAAIEAGTGPEAVLEEFFGLNWGLLGT
jgi:hypothetical protein